jgi:hypothetical protein
VCEKCWKANNRKAVASGESYGDWSWDNSVGAWPSGREMFDEDGIIECWPDTDQYGHPNKALVKGPPPKWCPYQLEHAVSEVISRS